MKPEVKKQWLEALRSNEYQQTKGVLHRVKDGKSEFCCLGVLCDIYVKANPDKARWESRACGTVVDEVQYFHSGKESSDGLLPEVVINWAGTNSLDPEVTSMDESMTDSLSQFNDDGASFTEIADMIERDL